MLLDKPFYVVRELNLRPHANHYSIKASIRPILEYISCFKFNKIAFIFRLHRLPIQLCWSCRPFVTFATSLAGLVGCRSFFCRPACSMMSSLDGTTQYTDLSTQLVSLTTQAWPQKKLQQPTRPAEDVTKVTKGLQEQT